MADSDFISKDNMDRLAEILKEAFFQNEKAQEFLCNDLPALYLNFEYPDLSLEEFQEEKDHLTTFVSHLLENGEYHSDMVWYLARAFKRQTRRIRVRKMLSSGNRN